MPHTHTPLNRHAHCSCYHWLEDEKIKGIISLSSQNLQASAPLESLQKDGLHYKHEERKQRIQETRFYLKGACYYTEREMSCTDQVIVVNY